MNMNRYQQNHMPFLSESVSETVSEINYDDIIWGGPPFA